MSGVPIEGTANVDLHSAKRRVQTGTKTAVLQMGDIGRTIDGGQREV